MVVDTFGLKGDWINRLDLIRQLYHNPEFYILLGFILVVSPSIIFLLIGRYDLSNFNYMMTRDSFILCIINIASMTLWGFYEHKILGWIGGIVLIAISMFSIYIIPGSIFLFIGIIFKNFNKDYNHDI